MSPPRQHLGPIGQESDAKSPQLPFVVLRVCARVLEFAMKQNNSIKQPSRSPPPKDPTTPPRIPPNFRGSFQSNIFQMRTV